MKYIVDIKGEIEGDYEIIGKYEEIPQGEAECMEEDAKQASIPYTYSSPQHDWKCGYPDSTGGKKD